jgi:prophage maintenance system killer protein
MLYLSVHDLVWINSMVCGEPTPYDYELLEEAVAAQYGYGDSTDVLSQGADFAVAMAVGKPFETGNLRTGLVALSAYLQGNGYALKLDLSAAAEKLVALARGSGDGDAVVDALLEGEGGVSLRRAPTVGGSDQIVLDRGVVIRTIGRCRPVLDVLAADDGPVPGRTFSPYLHRD